MQNTIKKLFDLTDRVAVITGGAGLLGREHAKVLADAGARIVLVDLPGAQPDFHAQQIQPSGGMGIATDITDPVAIRSLSEQVLERFGRIDILINNAANNPKVESPTDAMGLRFENLPLDLWNRDLSVGLTGAFLCSQVLGSHMAQSRQGGVILNIASDLALISPDQRLYRQPGLQEHEQPVKPVTYSVVKTALIGLTRYLATYWAEAGIRVNALSPGGVANRQPEEFVANLSKLIPLARMAKVDEYQAAVLFLCSDASSYMTGANLIMDGGRSVW
jgi:NAD(P)-dependent dehydrogenase (short-subunit alcohol dehydrogenase family)